ncbi:MAG: DUF1697 domain-containing protein [Clostridia bacterium]|jgi:uncharacterized protein (DUF1697 family)|nr:DUF1697 domain-containing protein [Clostridia bacterium]
MELRIGFFRGLNVGGKNIISMSHLTNIFYELGYEYIKTIGNTGVILFFSHEILNNVDAKIAKTVSDNTNIPVGFLSIHYDELKSLIHHAPKWWNKNKDWRHNAIFLLGNLSANQIISELPTIDENIEKIDVFENIILWSSSFAERKLYYRSEYRKLLKNESYPFMTIRNANTLNKTYAEATKLLEEK